MNEMKELWELLNLLAEKEEAKTKESPKKEEEKTKEPITLAKPKNDIPETMKTAIDSAREWAAYYAAFYKMLCCLEVPEGLAYDLTVTEARNR